MKGHSWALDTMVVKKHMFWYRYYIHYNYNSSTQITEFHSSAPLKYCAATKGACPKPIITIAFLNIKRILFTLPEEDFHFAFSHLWQILYFYQPLAMTADIKIQESKLAYNWIHEFNHPQPACQIAKLNSEYILIK